MNRRAAFAAGHRPGRRRPAVHWGLATLCLWLWAAPQVLAHPHAWVDVIVVFETNGRDEVDAMTQTWVIDPTYSRYLHDDAMTQFEGGTPEEKLANLGAEILDNLGEYAWYTELYADDRRIEVEPQGGAEMLLDGSRLRFRFRLVLAQPVAPRTQTLRYAIYDPTFMIEVLHDTGTPPHLELSSGPCQLEILKPRPDPAIVARALALDFNQTGEADLGRHFAERVTAHCD